MPFQHRRLAVSIQSVLLGSGLALTSLGCQADSPFIRTSAESSADSASQNAQLALGPRTVTVEPGSNVILELAIDHLNRIVTPFRAPSVRTVSSVSTEVDGHVLYVATAEETPATLYITDADDAQTTVALTLAPRRVPPREIRLRVPGLEAGRKRSEPRPGDVPSAGPVLDPPPVATWRQPPHYIDELTQGFRALALGEVPDGYRNGRRHVGEAIRCGAAFQVRQVKAFDGEALRFLTAKVQTKGTSKVPAILDESQCRLGSKQSIAAVALWPNGPLDPGTEATLIVAVDPARTHQPGRRDHTGGPH